MFNHLACAAVPFGGDGQEYRQRLDCGAGGNCVAQLRLTGATLIFIALWQEINGKPSTVR